MAEKLVGADKLPPRETDGAPMSRRLSDGEAVMKGAALPDAAALEGAKRKLVKTKTLDKHQLPTDDQIKTMEGEAAAARKAAEEKLVEGRSKLKPPEAATQEKQRLPTADDINAENSATLEAAEILSDAKNKLKPATVVEKQALPTKECIEVEKKDRTCDVKPVDVSSDQMTKAKESQAASTAKGLSLGTVDRSSLATGGAGAGGGLGLNAPGHNVKVQHFAGGGSGVTAKKRVNISDDVNAAWQNVLDDANKTSWIYCKYTDDLKSLNLHASGEGGLSEFKKQVTDELGWGGIRCYGVDKRGGTEVRRTKFIFVQIRAEGASQMKKAKQSSHKGNVKEVLTSTHLDLAIDTVADLEEQGLIKMLQSATGAHKPNGYEFDPGNFIEADYYGLGIGKDCKGETAKS